MNDSEIRPLIVFDVNETLLDLETMVPIFERIFGDPSATRLWFAILITYSEALTLSGVYVPFTDIGAAVLQMVAATRGVTITEATADEFTARFASMPHTRRYLERYAASATTASGSSP